jgi:hypothetical protein
LRTPPINNIFPHLFYTNAKKFEHNKIIFQNTTGQTFPFHAKDIHFETCFFHFRLSMIPNPNLHHELLIKNILIKLCAGNYITIYDFINGVNGILRNYT